MGHNDKKQQKAISLSKQQLYTLHGMLTTLSFKTNTLQFEHPNTVRNITIILKIKEFGSPISFQLSGDEAAVLESDVYQNVSKRELWLRCVEV